MSDNSTTVVLVADDEPSTLAMVASHLRSKGYTVLEASDGDQAWELAHEHLPHLVVLDVMMPGMSGWEVCRKIREAVSLAHTGVLMLTGIGENLNEMTSPLYGADAHVDKPFEFAELDRRVKEVLARRRAGALGRVDEESEESLAHGWDEIAAAKNGKAPALRGTPRPVAKTKPRKPPAKAMPKPAFKSAAKPEKKAAKPAAKPAVAAKAKPAKKPTKPPKKPAKPAVAARAKPAKKPAKTPKKAATPAKKPAKPAKKPAKPAKKPAKTPKKVARPAKKPAKVQPATAAKKTAKKTRKA